MAIIFGSGSEPLMAIGCTLSNIENDTVNQGHKSIFLDKMILDIPVIASELKFK